jgi:uncharacterized protein (TIGR04255 family)
MHEDKHYDRPFLKEVIARVDYADPTGELASRPIPKAVKEAALKAFPISEPIETVADQVQLSVGEMRHKSKTFVEWNFHGENRTKRLAIAPEYAFVSYTQYESYEILRADFLDVLRLLFSEHSSLVAHRLGLRYINTINRKDRDPLEWSDLIEGKLLGLVRAFSDEKTASHLFNVAEFLEEDFRMKFKFGIPNPDYPAPIRRPQFVLDLDGFFPGPLDFSDIEVDLDTAHDRIQDLFETSITTTLRELMSNAGN